MWIQDKGAYTTIVCKIHPNSSKESIEGIRDDHLIIRLCAPPVEGKANKALIKLISKRLRIAKSKISIEQGEKGRVKVLSLEGISPDEVLSRLNLTQ